MDCIFCNLPEDRNIILENTHCYSILDKYPIVEGHSLIIPKRHFPEYFEIEKKELMDVHDLLLKVKNHLVEQDPKIEGFNIGINSGSVAGQTIFHLHIHLIPRRVGDVKYPRGGIRHLIPEKGYY